MKRVVILRMIKKIKEQTLTWRKYEAIYNLSHVIFRYKEIYMDLLMNTIEKKNVNECPNIQENR